MFRMRHRPRLIWGAILIFGIGLAMLLRPAPKPPLDRLLADLNAKLPWHYQWVDDRLTRYPFPRRIVNRTLAKDRVIDDRKQSAAGKLAAMGTNAWPAVPQLVETVAANRRSAHLAASVLALMNACDHPNWSELEKRFAGQPKLQQYFVPLVRANFSPHSSHYRYVFGGVIGQHKSDAYLALRRLGVIGVGAIGPAAQGSIPFLIEVIHTDADHELWVPAAVALAKLGAERLRGVRTDSHCPG
jgi:hypothetical protein